MVYVALVPPLHDGAAAVFGLTVPNVEPLSMLFCWLVGKIDSLHNGRLMMLRWLYLLRHSIRPCACGGCGSSLWIGRHCWRFVMAWWRQHCDASKKCSECCVLVIVVYWGVVLCVVNSASVLTPNFHDPMLDRCIFNVRYCQFDVSDLFYMGIRG